MTNYLDLPLRQYLCDAAAGEPTPGGGSVAALVGGLATTMATMTAHFTLGRKKYRDVEPQVRRQLELFQAHRDRFTQLMQDDMAAYAAVLAAYRLPKESKAEQADREQAIEQAIVKAMSVPLKTAETAVETLHATAALAEIANPNLLSDAAVAAVLAAAVFDCARINVEVNLKLSKDADLVDETRQSLERLADDVAASKAACLDTIASRQS